MKAKTPPVVQDSSTKKKKVAEKKTPTKKVASAKPPGKLPRVKPAKKASLRKAPKVNPLSPLTAEMIRQYESTLRLATGEPDAESALRFLSKVKNDFDFMDAVKLVHHLVGENADDQKANAWLIENRELLTTNKLRLIVHAAMIHQDIALIYTRTKDKQLDSKRKNLHIMSRWSELKREGKKKGEAAKIIAAEVNQTEETVRKKLQGDKSQRQIAGQ